MPKFIDLTGQKYGKLTVIERVEDYVSPKNRHEARWLCICDCGRKSRVRTSDLRSGQTKTCGCTRRFPPHEPVIKHGFCQNGAKRLYRIWSGMKSRCKQTEGHNYKYYTQKNIKVCAEWEDFENFKDWALLNGYQENLSIDRINGNLGYSPDNCRWVDINTQNRNKSNNVYITLNGVTKCRRDWEVELNLYKGFLIKAEKKHLSEKELLDRIEKYHKRWGYFKI